MIDCPLIKNVDFLIEPQIATSSFLNKVDIENTLLHEEVIEHLKNLNFNFWKLPDCAYIYICNTMWATLPFYHNYLFLRVSLNTEAVSLFAPSQDADSNEDPLKFIVDSYNRRSDSINERSIVDFHIETELYNNLLSTIENGEAGQKDIHKPNTLAKVVFPNYKEPFVWNMLDKSYQTEGYVTKGDVVLKDYTYEDCPVYSINPAPENGSYAKVESDTLVTIEPNKVYWFSFWVRTLGAQTKGRISFYGEVNLGITEYFDFGKEWVRQTIKVFTKERKTFHPGVMAAPKAQPNSRIEVAGFQFEENHSARKHTISPNDVEPLIPEANVCNVDKEEYLKEKFWAYFYNTYQVNEPSHTIKIEDQEWHLFEVMSDEKYTDIKYAYTAPSEENPCFNIYVYYPDMVNEETIPAYGNYAENKAPESIEISGHKYRRIQVFTVKEFYDAIELKWRDFYNQVAGLLDKVPTIDVTEADEEPIKALYGIKSPNKVAVISILSQLQSLQSSYQAVLNVCEDYGADLNAIYSHINSLSATTVTGTKEWAFTHNSQDITSVTDRRDRWVNPNSGQKGVNSSLFDKYTLATNAVKTTTNDLVSICKDWQSNYNTKVTELSNMTADRNNWKTSYNSKVTELANMTTDRNNWQSNYNTKVTELSNMTAGYNSLQEKYNKIIAVSMGLKSMPVKVNYGNDYSFFITEPGTYKTGCYDHRSSTLWGHYGDGDSRCSVRVLYANSSGYTSILNEEDSDDRWTEATFKLTSSQVPAKILYKVSKYNDDSSSGHGDFYCEKIS